PITSIIVVATGAASSHFCRARLGARLIESRPAEKSRRRGHIRLPGQVIPIGRPQACRSRGKPPCSNSALPEEDAMLRLPEVRVGAAIAHEALAVFPLFTTSTSSVDYLLADEAIAAGTVAVEEVGEAGSVPDLLVSNRGDSRVLFIEGEE